MHGPEPSVERAVTEGIAMVQPLVTALAATSAYMALHVDLYQHLQHGFRHGVHEVAICCFRQQIGRWRSVLGYRFFAGQGGSLATHPVSIAWADSHRNPHPGQRQKFHHLRGRYPAKLDEAVYCELGVLSAERDLIRRLGSLGRSV